MSTKYNQFREIERKLQELLQQQEEIQKSEEFQQDKQFADELQKLMNEYGKNEREVLQILAPNSYQEQAPATSVRKRGARVEKTYINPHTNEKVVTKGGNQKTLLSWKKEYGAEEVESWLQS